MFSANESTFDRVIRFIVGAVLIYAWYAMWVTGTMAIIALTVGIILAVTGIIGWCPLYRLFGIGTRSTTT